MGQAAWLVTEKRLMETVRWDNSGDIYIVYKETEQ